MARRHRIAVIAGDGIGREVVPETLRVLNAAAEVCGFEIAPTAFDWSCERFLRSGSMMPDDGLAQLAHHDAIFLGAVGDPRVPDHLSLWGLLIPIRREFDRYVSLRPVRLLPGVPCPLVGKQPGDIDFWVVRENSEGEFAARRPHRYWTG